MFNTWPILGDLSSQGKYSILKKLRIKQATELYKITQAKGANILFCSKESERFYHLSIFDDGKHYYAKFGRVILTVDMKKVTLILHVVLGIEHAPTKVYVYGT